MPQLITSKMLTAPHVVVRKSYDLKNELLFREQV